jgi:hypothetical protein
MCDSSSFRWLLMCDSSRWLLMLVQWVLQVMSPSACSFIVCWFPLSFTTCFSLHGHLQVCRIFHMLKGFCLDAFLVRCLSLHVVTLCMFSTCVLFLYCFPLCFLVFSCLCVCLLANFIRRAPKNTQENNTGTKHKWETCSVWPRGKKQQSSILKYMKIKYPTHLKMAM